MLYIQYQEKKIRIVSCGNYVIIAKCTRLVFVSGCTGIWYGGSCSCTPFSSVSPERRRVLRKVGWLADGSALGLWGHATATLLLVAIMSGAWGGARSATAVACSVVFVCVCFCFRSWLFFFFRMNVWQERGTNTGRRCIDDRGGVYGKKRVRSRCCKYITIILSKKKNTAVSITIEQRKSL